MPACVACQDPPAPGELILKQTFQMIYGTLKTAGGAVQITNGKLRGEEISFSAGGRDVEL